MFQEFQLDDLTFAIFPKVGARVSDVYGSWAKNSVGDIIEVLMQMLEVRFIFCSLCNVFNVFAKALVFIHQNNIAHRVCLFLRTNPIF
jgi:hypothetical protein